MTELSLTEKLRGEHAAIRAARRQRRFVRRRNRLLLGTLVCYLVFLVAFLIWIPA